MIAVARPDESQVNVTCRPNDIARLVSDFRDKLLFGNLVVLSSAVPHFARDDEDKRYVVDQEMLEDATARLLRFHRRLRCLPARVLLDHQPVCDVVLEDVGDISHGLASNTL